MASTRAKKIRSRLVRAGKPDPAMSRRLWAMSPLERITPTLRTALRRTANKYNHHSLEEC